MVVHGRGSLEGELPHLDGRVARVRKTRRTDRLRRRRRVHLSDVRFRADPGARAAPGGWIPTAASYPACDVEQCANPGTRAASGPRARGMGRRSAGGEWESAGEFEGAVSDRWRR